MKTFKCLAALAAFITVLSGCQKEPENKPGDNPGNEKISYEITVPESDQYTVAAPESATEGEEVSLTITVAEGTDIKIVSVKYNDESCGFVSEDGLTSTYSFTMPAEDVAISVETAATAFSISWKDTDTYKISGLNPKAKPGDKIGFTVSVTDLVYKVTEVTYGEGLTCAMEGEPELENNDPVNGSLNYSFSFTMPENDVTIEVSAEENFFRIYRTSPAHGNIVMLSLIKKGSNGQPETDSSIRNENDRIVCEGRHGDKAEFTIEPESDSWRVKAVSVSGKSTGDRYNISNTGDTYSFTMPAEEILITAEMEEVLLDIYEGKDFVGDYSGYVVKSGFSYRNLLYSPEAPTLTYTLMANTTYSIKESDDSSYDGSGKYIFNEEDNSFSYDTGAMAEGEPGLSGTYQDGFYLVTLNKVGQSISYARSYIAAMDAAGSASISDFVSASDDMGYNVLIGFKINNEDRYYLYEQLSGQSYSPVTVDFTSGSSLAEDGVQADIIKDGSIIYRYSVNGTTPVFKSKGIEAGTYEGPSGQLVLDGFGSGTLAGVQGTYTTDSNIITFVDNSGNSTKAVLDYGNMTYSIYSEWDGPMYYSATTGNADDGSGNPTDATVILNLGNYDSWSGALNPIFRIETMYSFEDSISYTYDANAGTLTIMFIDSWTKEPKALQGNPDLYSIVFKVSDDKQTLEMLDVETIINAYGIEFGSVPVSGMKLTAGY